MSSSRTASTAVPALTMSRTLRGTEARHEFGHGVGAADRRALRRSGEVFPSALRGAVVDHHAEAVVVDVQREILTHHGEADQADVGRHGTPGSVDVRLVAVVDRPGHGDLRVTLPTPGRGAAWPYPAMR